jgi:ferredoxin, 2Fe-2S
MHRTPVHFTVFYDGKKYELQTYAGEYRNLMQLLYEKIYIEDFGECKGMGRCGTCVIKVRGLPGAFNTLERNEESTLNKLGITGEGIRLACQILVDENVEAIVVDIIAGDSVE